MAQLNSDLVLRQMPWHSTMTELNHLGAALIAKPHRFSGEMMQIFSSHRYSDNPLTAMLSGTARDVAIDKSEWEWDLRGATTRPLIVVENVIDPAITQPGLFKTEFDIKLDEPWFVAGDVIHPGTSNKKYQLRIQRDAIPHGSGYVYRVRMNSDEPDAFLPLQYLATGTKWAKLFAQYEEGAEQSGSTQYFLPQTLSSRMSRYRKHYKVTGDAAQEVLAVAIPDSAGKMHKMWIKYAEVEFWQQWYRELERGLWYSRSTNSVKGSTGRSTLTGPGVQQLLEKSHRHYYTSLSARLIEEYLMDIFYSRVTPGSQRKIKAYTGEYGMILFHRAVQDELSKKGFIQVMDNTFVQKSSSPYHSNGLSFGAQFTTYKMANGAELELIHNPLYDDREINWEIDPETGYPLESMRFTFLDFSGEGKDSNIKLMRKKGAMKLGYVAGLQTPYGVANKQLMSHSGDYYEMHIQDQMGVHIHDITRCGELIPKRAA